MRFPLLFAMILAACPLTIAPAPAADLYVAVPAGPSEEDGAAVIRTTLANYLALELTRVTFDVLALDEVEGRIERRIVAWGGQVPGAEERAEIARQLLAEGSYYLTSLSYLIQAGGAIFPDDRPEASHAGDALVRLDALQRELADGLAAGDDVSSVLREAEAIRALTEGYDTPPPGFGPMGLHARMLEDASTLQRLGTPL